ncbi:thermonuclease family protein [Qipengyuania sp. DY56-A-20]|uniref:Thermonuclease family protein n=1 Tax=Qipengyuania benthica TaxID=3067651 RepID=A0ABT9H9Y6_9SPHN|nr:thermonuclease family protein [Qipengyuania sp. DY56-A-20]MDP4540136.1 thermonuclease family protein [Qipengyuania sp. DY56-A-20]
MSWPGTPADPAPVQWPGQPASGQGAKPKGSPPKAKGLFGSKKAGPVTLEAPVATDGDTVRDGETRVRLVGVDAPEIGQQGWDRTGGTVPIGTDSQDYLQGFLGNGPATVGPQFGQSWGRTVAPISAGQDDAGRSILRQGYGLAAPDYLESDPQRQRDYLEAERRARQNRLGMHGTFAQTPEQHRDNPGYVAPRETIAQFWDTPTPDDGLPPEVEAQYLGLLKTGTADEINAFLALNNYETTRPDDLRSWVAKRDAGGSVEPYVGYASPPPLMIDSGDGAVGAGVRKFGSGFLAGGLDELGAVVDTLGGTDGRESLWNSDRRLADIWANNQRQNTGVLSYDQTTYPGVSTGAEITGVVTSGFALPFGAGARTVPQLAKVGAAWGGTEAFLGSDGSAIDRAKNVPLGATMGAIADPLLGKTLQAVAPVLSRAWSGLRGPGGSRDVAAFRGAPVRTSEGAQGEPWPGTPAEGEAMPEGGFAGGSGAAGSPSHPPEWPGRKMSDAEALSPANENQPTTAFEAELSRRWDMTTPDLEADAKGEWDATFEEAIEGKGYARDGYLGAADMQQGRDGLFYNPDDVTAARDASDSHVANWWQGRADAVADGVRRDMAMDAEPGQSLSAPAPRRPDYLDMGAQRPRRLLDAATDAERMAAAQGVQPRDVLPMPGNIVEGPQEAAAIDSGRFAPASVPNERTMLGKRTVTNYMGREVPKVGPVDMVGWLRTQGGLREQGGELSTIGIDNNAARRGLDHIGQEMRFGPIRNDQDGMSLDDAALAAWEAGYFPELPDRPDVNTFLDALGETYNGGAGRRFRPEDAPEIDAFEATQAERFDLEQQQLAEGGPVWADRSTPGDSAEPFAPPEAYVEWPSDAIARVGNVDVSKLDTPQDIRRALKSSFDTLGGFDAATRGRITQAETERLASELNMTPESLLSRRKGQAFNAEEALAARQMLAKSGNELVNAAKRIRQLEEPGDEALAEFRQKWMRHVAIQEQVSGMTAEAGRALAQFRQAASSRSVRGDVLASLVRAGGGREELQDAARVLIEASETSPGVFNAVAEKARQPKWQNKLSEFYINFLLSNPPTHIVNMVSNTATSIAQIPEYATASAIGAARRAIAGKGAKERIMGREVGARAFGLIQGTKEGARLFAKALRTGEADDFASKVEGDEFKAIRGMKGEILRIPTRLLTAEDQLFKGIARRMELNAQAVRIATREGKTGAERETRIAELLADPTDDMYNRALDYGRYLTFQRKLGKFGQGISNVTSSNIVAKVVVPFVRTPINLMKFATERSPAAPLLKEWREDFAAGGDRRDLAIAKSVLGSGFAAVIYQAAQEGVITGAVPPDPAKARLLYADGWQPYSVKVGDRYVSYSRLDPFSTTIGVAADMATLPSGLSDKQADDKATMLVASIMGNLASKTWLSGMSDFVAALDDPGRYAGNWMERVASSFAVPAGVAGVARAIDPISRRRESVGEAIQARIPGMTDDLLPRRDIFGEAIENDSLGPDFFSPFWQSREKNDPVIAEMLRIDKSVSAPGKQYTEDGERIDYAPDVYDRYHEISGRLTYNALGSLIRSDEYRALDEAGKRRAAKKAIRDAREVARSHLGDDNYTLPAKGALSQPAWPGGARNAPAGGDVWPGQPASPVSSAPEVSWPGQPVAQRDVMGSLEQAIPGVGITSGFRSAEYQADMRRRGYKPAANSRHLDGSALDLTPPPGRSMGWLAAQVGRLEPEASVLNEGDHLHVVFPDWNGAPMLGGMAM